MGSALVILMVGVQAITADTQVSLPVKPSTIIETNQVAVDNSIYTDRFQNFYEDVDDGNILAPSPTDDVARQDIFAGVNGGLVIASFLAAMGSSLVVPWLRDGVSRLMESGLPKVEITLPDTTADDSEEMEDMDEAVTKVKRSPKFQRFVDN